jgi:hypothetical protein
LNVSRQKFFAKVPPGASAGSRLLAQHRTGHKWPSSGRGQFSQAVYATRPIGQCGDRSPCDVIAGPDPAIQGNRLRCLRPWMPALIPGSSPGTGMTNESWSMSLGISRAVAPGLLKDEPQTTVVWRTHLPVRTGSPRPPRSGAQPCLLCCRRRNGSFLLPQELGERR